MKTFRTCSIQLSFVLWISSIKVTENYKMCYSCTRIPYPRDCNHVTKCSENENCMTKQYVSDSGHVWYDTGCIAKERCLQRRRFVRQTILGDVSGDITICQECCHDELCNTHGCTSQDLPDRSSRGPVCFSCNQQRYPDSCDIVSICQQSEACYLQFLHADITNDPIYSTGCINISKCPSHLNPHMLRALSNTCTGCCTGDYCNRNCSALETATFPAGTTMVTISNSESTAKTGFKTSTADSPTSTADSQTSTADSQLSHPSSTTQNPKPHQPFEQNFCETTNYTFDVSLHICYKIFTDMSLSWQQSRNRCRHDGGDLIIFHSLKEELVFETMSKDIYKNNLPEIRFWVGATDILTEMQFQWLDGSQVDPAFFHPNEPNNAYDGEDCLAATFFDNQERRVLLNDDKCSLPSHFICELDINNLQNTHVSSGSNQGPCRNADYTYTSEINMCYKIHQARLTMTEARTRCQHEHADLLILRNLQAELYFQRLPFHDKNNDNRYWIGGQRTSEDQLTWFDGQFTWFDGSLLSKSLKWFDGEPNNYEQNESCISMTYFNGDRENFFLNDDNCAKQLFFICEEKCPDMTYRFIPSLNLCFKIYNDAVTWSDARNRCQQDRASLAEVDTIADLSYFQLLLEAEAHQSGHKYWVGGKRTNNHFSWVSTNHVIAKELWHDGEPSSTAEDCVALHWFPAPYGNKFKLNNRPCTFRDRFICQYIFPDY